jgi:hypothetical protein
MVGLRSAGLRSESPHVTQWDETARGTLAVLVTCESDILAGTASARGRRRKPGTPPRPSGEATVGGRWLARGPRTLWRYLVARGCCRLLSKFPVPSSHTQVSILLRTHDNCGAMSMGQNVSADRPK